ncbi:helix-turn-helix domain-containing protein [Rhizobium leguminosarum]
MTRPGHFSTDLKTARKAVRMSQSELALALGVEQATISRWERGAEPTLDNLALIGKFFREQQVEFPYLQSVLTDMVAGEIRKQMDFVPLIGKLRDFGLVKSVKDDSRMDLSIPFRATEKTRCIMVETADLHPYFSDKSVLYFEDPEPGAFAPEGVFAFGRGEGTDMYIGEFFRGTHKTMFTVRTAKHTVTGVYLKCSAPIKAASIR